MMFRFFDLKTWGIRHFVALGIILLSINLLGPKGLLHYLLIKQKITRLNYQEKGLVEKQVKLDKEIYLIKNSSSYQKKLIREHLGLLQKNEVSIEFIPHK